MTRITLGEIMCRVRIADLSESDKTPATKVAAHRRLDGVDDDYTAVTARADIRQPAPAGCGVVAHRRLAGVDDLYTAAAAIRQPAPAGCWA